MKRIIVTGATSMIGTALIEECIRHDIEVYAVVPEAKTVVTQPLLCPCR